MPEDQTSLQRIELVDGVLLVSPAPTSTHQRILQKILLAFAPAVPEDTELLPGVNVRFGGRRLLIPDLVVLTCPAVDAEARIPFYLLVEPGEPSTAPLVA